MRQPRIHVDMDLGPGRRVELPKPAREHLVTVLRMRDGAAVTLFDGRGCDWPGILRVGRGSAVVELGEALPVDTESPLAITLAQAIARGEKMDLILQKATELGVARIVPLVTERTEVRLDAERAGRRLDHWRRVVAGACEQSGRARVPRVDPPTGLPRFIAEMGPGSLRLALDPDANGRLAAVVASGPITIVVGPEGGLGERDFAALAAGGFTGVRLGPRILRTETAGLAALAVLQARAGDLG